MKNPIQTTTIHKLGLCSLMLVGCSPSGSTMSMMEENDGQAISKGQDTSLLNQSDKLTLQKICQELDKKVKTSQHFRENSLFNQNNIRTLHLPLLQLHEYCEALVPRAKEGLSSMDSIALNNFYDRLIKENHCTFDELHKKMFETSLSIGCFSTYEKQLDRKIELYRENELKDLTNAYSENFELFIANLQPLITENLSKLKEECARFKEAIEKHKQIITENLSTLEEERARCKKATEQDELILNYQVFNQVIDDNLMNKLDQFAEIVKEINATIGNLLMEKYQKDALSVIINGVISELYHGLLSLFSSGNDILLDVNFLEISSDERFRELIKFFARDIPISHIGQMLVRVGRILFLLEAIPDISLDIHHEHYLSNIVNDHSTHLYNKMNEDNWRKLVASKHSALKDFCNMLTTIASK